MIFNTNSEPKRAYSVAEASKETTLSKPFLRKKMKEGALKGTWFGRRVVILAEDLERFLKSGATASGATNK